MNINSLQTVAIAGVFLLFGYLIQRQGNWWKRLYIPAPFIGGIILAIVMACLKVSHYKINLDYSMLPVFVAGFFASIGLRCDTNMLKKGFKFQVMFLGIVIVVAFFQNIVSLLIGKIIGFNPFQTVIFGSMGLMGDGSVLQGVPSMMKAGHAYLGLFSGFSVMGNILATILGGLLFVVLKRKTMLDKSQAGSIGFKPYEFIQHMLIFIIVVSIGLLPTQMGWGRWINPAGGAFLAGMVVRQLLDVKKKSIIQSPQVNIIGNFSLSMLLIISFMSMDLTTLTQLNLIAIIMFAIQAVLLMLFSYYVVYRLFQKDALASYVASGLIGFSLGMPASTMSTLQCIGEGEGAIPVVLYIVPPVGAWLISAINPYLIQLFLK